MCVIVLASLLMVDWRTLLHVDPYRNIASEGTWGRIRKVMSPRYVVSKGLLTLHEIRNPGEPWITRDAILLFDALIRPHHCGLEWGSGNGSAWIAKRCSHLVSVEHHASWHAKISEVFRKEHIKNVDYRLVDEIRYLDVVEGFEDEHFDFIVVDGLFRDEAFLRSLPKLRRNGFAVFDNVNWFLPSRSKTPHSRNFADGPATAKFSELLSQLESWKCIWTTNGVNDTAIYLKPNQPPR